MLLACDYQVEYRKGGRFEPKVVHSTRKGLTPPSVQYTGSADARLTLEPRLTLTLWGTLPVEIDVQPYVGVEVAASRTQTCDGFTFVPYLGMDANIVVKDFDLDVVVMTVHIGSPFLPVSQRMQVLGKSVAQDKKGCISIAQRTRQPTPAPGGGGSPVVLAGCPDTCRASSTDGKCDQDCNTGTNAR